MKKVYVFGIFIVIVLAQLVVPMNMIYSKEKIISDGTVYKFKTRPIDPNDPFRGKYITLRYEINKAHTKDTLWDRNDDVFVYLKTDSLGFANISQVSKTKLNLDTDFVKAKVRWYNKRNEEVLFRLEFDRYYMEESKAKDAEMAYNEVHRVRIDSLPNNVYGLVYVKDGEAILTDVIINDIPIKEYVEKGK